MYLKPDDYKGQTNKFTYPREYDPKKKQEDAYYKAVCEAMMADYCSGNFYTSWDGNQRSIDELWAYAKGKQGAEKIKKWILGRKKLDKNTGKEAYITKMNVSWDIYQKLPQMFDQMRSKNMSNEYDVDLSCIDDDSVAARQATEGMLKFLIDEETKKFADKAVYKVNVQPNPDELGLQTNEDVEMYMENGGFMLEWEIAALAACKKTKLASNYNMLQDMIFDDLLINPEGITGIKVEIDPTTSVPKFRKVNMRHAVIPYSYLPDFSDKVRDGEIRRMSIAEIRTECPHLRDGYLRKLAKDFAWMNPDYERYCNQPGVGYFRTLRQENDMQGYDSDPVNRVKVLVADFQWLSDDIETRHTNDYANGGRLYKEVDYDFKLSKKAVDKGEKVIQKKTIRKYYAKWVIGTDCFLSRGIDNHQIFYGEEGNLTPKTDYFWTRTGNSSMIERCVAIADDINLILMKHRNAWATLPAAPAIAIQKGLVENVFLNGQRQSPMDLIQGLIERGILYYDAIDDHGDPKYLNGGVKPIEALDVAKMAQMLTVCSNEMALKVNELREVLGLQGGSDGGQTNPYQGLGQTRLAFEAANSSLMPTFKAYHYLFKNMFDHAIKMWQVVAAGKKNNKIRASALGVKNMKVLELGKSFTSSEFNIAINIAPTIEEKQMLLAEITKLKDLGTTTGGKQGLSVSEYLFLYEKIMAGNIKEAMYVQARIDKKKSIKAEMEQRQIQQANQEANVVATQTKGEEDRASIVAKGEVANQNTLIAELLKTNRELMKLALQPKKEGESGVNEQMAMQEITNNEAVLESLLTQGQQPVSPEMVEQQQLAQQEQQIM